MRTTPNPQKNIETIRQILEDEIRGDISSALEKMADDYSMTWVYKRKDGTLFPEITSEQVRSAMKDVYVIKNREYKIHHIIAENDVVMAELVESYPDPEKSGVMYRTPMVIVWEFENSKIRRGRHYCDPQLSYLNLSEEEIGGIYK
ncbi:MAG: nuclear transport factor 2 family protein [Patescibacteria group bacterium]